MSKWLFVGGPGRSGTKLLAWCLRQHPDVYMTTQESCIAEQMRHFFEPTTLHSFEVEWQEHDGDSYWYQTGHLFGKDHGYEVELTAMDLARAALRGLAEHACPDKLYLGDKAPAYCNLWPVVRSLCPDSTFVFIRRDLEATVASWQRMGFGTDADTIRRTVNSRLQRAYQCPGALWVTLEELNADAEGTLTRLLLALQLDPARMDWPAVTVQVASPAHLN